MFKALFRKQFTVTVENAVGGTEGVQRAIMTLDTAELDRETAKMLKARANRTTDGKQLRLRTAQ